MAVYTTIDNPGLFFNTVLYTGNGTDDHAITGVNFQPDFVWIKTRSEANNHNLYDVIRGVNKPLKSNSTASEFTRTDALKSFYSDGFTLDDDATSDEVNKNTVTYASWNWLGANGTASNSDGSITSTVSANTTAGFSIVSYTGNATAGATIGHGLGVAPKWVIVKNRINAQNWFIYHIGIGATKVIYLDLTNAPQTLTQAWNDTAPTSSVVSLGTEAGTNQSGANMLAYCFAEKQGYSKFGSYTGNGNADGPMVYTGFKPAYLLIRRTDTTNNWHIHDNKRDPINQVEKYLLADTNGAESSDTNKGIDFLSNGFKLRTTHGSHNTSGGTYIFMAFGQSLVGTNNIPATAR